MINVVEEGGDKTVRFNCEICDCIFEADPRSYVIYKGLFRLKIAACCPSCGEITHTYMKRRQYKQMGKTKF